MTFLRAMTHRKPLNTGNLRPGNGGYYPPATGDIRPSRKWNCSPRQTTVSPAKLHAQNHNPKKSRSGNSQRSRNTCPSRSTPTPTDKATATRASATTLSSEKLHSANPLATQVIIAHGKTYVIPNPTYPTLRESRVDRAHRN